jgi:hypothetical protein
LVALKDMVADQDLFRRALDENVMGESLLRSVTVRSVEGQFKRILDGGAVLTEYSFRYDGPMPQESGVERLTLDFRVTPDSTPPTNIHVLIGRNGVGKTYLLNGMTRALVSPEEDASADGVFTSSDGFYGETHESPFANIVSITFSAFDDFALIPERRNVLKGLRYSNVGLRKRIKDKNDELVIITRDPTDLAKEFSVSAKLCAIGEKASRWQQALTTLQADPIFADAQVASRVAGTTSRDTITGCQGGCGVSIRCRPHAYYFTENIKILTENNSLLGYRLVYTPLVALYRFHQNYAFCLNRMYNLGD